MNELTHILEFTTGGKKYKITEEEAKNIIMVDEDKSFAVLRLGLSAPRRLVIIRPFFHEDEIDDRKKQQVGVDHEGTMLKRHFGQWTCGNLLPDDNGNYQAIVIDPKVYPEVGLDCVATPEEYAEIKRTGADYYEFLGIKDKIKRVGESKGFTPLIN